MTTKINFIACIALLNETRANLWNGVAGSGPYCPPCSKDRFVCCGLDTARATLGLRKTETNYLRDLISWYIDGESVFEYFYAAKNGILAREEVTVAECYEPRLEMIDALIRHTTFMAILENASARLWDGDSEQVSEHVKATYMCHAVAYAVIDVRKLSSTNKPYDLRKQSEVEKSEYFRTIQASIMAKLRIGVYQHNTAEGYCRETHGVYTAQELQAFRTRTMADITAEYAARAVV